MYQRKSCAGRRSSHRTDEAILYKLGLEDIGYHRIVYLRHQASLHPEYNAEGRVASYDYTGTKRWYDADGLDEDGFFCDGESPIPGAFNRDGWALRRPRYDGRTRKILYFRDGFDEMGYDEDGYGRDGFNVHGVNRLGFRRNRTHTATGTYEDREGYNFFGLKDGRDRNGKLDDDVAFAISYLEGPVMKLRHFAEQQKLDLADVRARFELAKRKMPALSERITERGTQARRQSFAVLNGDMRRVIDGDLRIEEFWASHPKLTIKSISEFDGSRDFLCFIGRQICSYNLKDNTATINRISKVLGAIHPSEMLEVCDLIRRTLPTPSKRTEGDVTAQQMHATQNFIKKFCNHNLSTLEGLKISLDGGKTFVVITAGDISKAEEQIRQRREVISCLTVKEEILRSYRN